MKNLLVLIIVLALIASAAYYVGWFGVATDSNIHRDKIELMIDKDKVKNDASKVSGAASDVKNRFASKQETTFDLSKTSVELPANSKTEVIATRSWTELKELQLDLNTSFGCNLVVSGGLFKQGSVSTIITIEAPRGSHDGRVSVSCVGSLQTVAVTVTH